MKKAGYIIYSILAIGATLFFIYSRSTSRNSEVKDEFKTYVPASGKIINKQQRVGSKARVIITYTIQYTASDGKMYKQTTRNVDDALAGSYENGDTLTVFYNPSNPNDPIIDRPRMETRPDTFSYTTILPYALGILIFVTAFYFYGIRKNRDTKNS